MATENCTTVADLPRLCVCGKRPSRLEVNPPSPMISLSQLGEDLLIEILIRSFPDPRSACRSKAVCKQWGCLISDPRFSRRFLSYHQSKNTLNHPPPKLLLSADSLLTFLPMPDRRPERFAVFDCFKDLLLCGFGKLGNLHTNAEVARSYLLCNPFTEQWVALPLAPQRPVGNTGLVARLVFEPLISNSLDLGGDYVYRFRVVCMYQDMDSTKLDVFCSESGEWKKEALVLHGYRLYDAVSCNGVLYARAQDRDAGLHTPIIVGFNPFRLDLPPTPVDVSPVRSKKLWSISVSQGALHLSVPESLSPMALSIWRLKEDGKFWRKVSQGSMKSPSGYNYQFAFLGFPTLHPEKPEIAYFTNRGSDDNGTGGHCYVSCDLGRGGEIEFAAKRTECFAGWRVFQPKLYCWPTPIPRYQKLRSMYDGSYRCWVQSNELITPSITEKWQPVDRVEQSALHRKKPKVAKDSLSLSRRRKGHGAVLLEGN